MPKTLRIVHLVPDRLVNPTGAYSYLEGVPAVECDVDATLAAELIATGAFHDAAELPPGWQADPPPAFPAETLPDPADAGSADSVASAVPAEEKE